MADPWKIVESRQQSINNNENVEFPGQRMKKEGEHHHQYLGTFGQSNTQTILENTQAMEGKKCCRRTRPFGRPTPLPHPLPPPLKVTVSLAYENETNRCRRANRNLFL